MDGMGDELVAGNLTLREVSGASFRLVMKDGTYRDFESGWLVILPSDPLVDELLEFARKSSNIEVIEAGQRLKEGQPICPVCGRVLATADGLPEHMAEIHVDEDGVRQMAGLPPKDEEATAPRRRR